MGGVRHSLCIQAVVGPALGEQGWHFSCGRRPGSAIRDGYLAVQGPQLNKLFMELGLVTAPAGSALECLHVCAEDNVLADELSRMKAGAREPACLRNVARTAWHSDARWWI